MKVLSLFDGISCGMVALERAGINVEKYYASEICDYSIKISKKNYPNIIHVGDIRSVDTKTFSQPIDLIIGGSPCRNFSLCSKGKGAVTSENIKVTTLEQYLSLKNAGCEFEGQSYLFWEFVRILKDLKPKYFLLENTPMKKEWEDVISEALGVNPVLINSADFTAQERKRLYWTNIKFEEHTQKNNSALKDIMETNVDEKFFYNCGFDFVGYDKAVCAMLNINGHDILKRVLSPSFKCHTLTSCRGGNLQKKVMDNGRPRKLTPIEYERLQGLPDNYTDGISTNNRYNVCGDGWTVDVIAHIFKGLINK